MSKYRQYDTSVFVILETIEFIYIIVDICQFVTCANGGSCRQVNTAQCFVCDCQVGFVGSMCQTKETVTVPSKVFSINICLDIVVFPSDFSKSMFG